MNKIEWGNKFKVWRSHRSATTNIIIDILLDVKTFCSFIIFSILFLGTLVLIGWGIYSLITR